MDLEKCEALKILGFKYITRDMDGRLTAWMVKPVRVMTVLEGNEDRIKRKFTDAVIYDIDKEPDADYTYKDGCNVDFCSFQCSKEDEAWDYGHMDLNKNDEGFKEITWENSPYNI